MIEKHNGKNQQQLLHNSSQIFNAERIIINQENLNQQNQRMKRLLGVGTSVVTEDAKTVKNSQVQQMLRREQNAISNLIDQLNNLKVGLQNCQKTHQRAKTTDISPQDQKFLMDILFEHGYISEKIAKRKGGIIQILQDIRQNEKELPIQYQQCQNNEEMEQNYRDSQFVKLQNCQSSRLPQGYNLCSLDYQMNNLLHNSKQCEQCSKQLDVISQNQVTNNNDNKSQNRYEMSPKTIKSQKNNKVSLQEQNKQIMHVINVKQNREDKNNKKIKLPSFQAKWQNAIGGSKLYNCAIQGKQKGIKGYKREEISREWYNEDNSQDKKIVVEEIGKQTITGKLGDFYLSIHLSSVDKIYLQHGLVILFVKPLGKLITKFKNKLLSDQFFSSICKYSLYQ